MTNNLKAYMKSLYSGPVMILFLIWLLMQSALMIKNGIVTNGEAAKYIEQAHLFLSNGTLSSANFWLYSTEIFLIAFVLKLKIGFAFVVAIQLLLNLLASSLIYYAIKSLFDPAVAFICALLFILNYPLQEFNSFLQTESIFYSITIIFSYYLFTLSELNARRLIYIFIFLALICFTRPTGLIFIPLACIYLFFRFFKGVRILYKFIIMGVVFLAFLSALNLALGSGGELDFMLPFRDERIICGVPTTPGFLPIKEVENGNSIYGLLYYITHNFEQFTRLAFLRAVSFFKQTRPYYSTGHNIFLIAFFYPVYVFALLSIRSFNLKYRSQYTYCIIVILLLLFTVMLTCDDWHNRWFLTITPYLNFLCIPAFQKIVSKFPA